MRRTYLNPLTVAFAALFLVSFYSFANLGGDAGIRLPYQGYLEFDGAPVNVDTSLTFRIYDTSTNGTPCHSEVHLVTPANGTFAVNLGPIPEGCVVAKEVWIQIETNEGPLLGRQLVVPAMASATSGKGGDFYVDGALDVMSVANVDSLEVTTNATVGGTMGTASLGVTTDATVGGTTSTLSLDVTTDATVGGALDVAENVSAYNAVVGDVGHGLTYAGFSHDTLPADGTNYALLQSSDGRTYLNSSSAESIYFRSNNTNRMVMDTNGNLDVNGRVLRSEYDVACTAGSSGRHYPYCCRMNVRNGATDCKVTTTTIGGSWNTVPSPFATGSNGPYSLSCLPHVSNVNYAFCCRTSFSGATECKVNVGYALSGAWTSAGNPF